MQSRSRAPTPLEHSSCFPRRLDDVQRTAVVKRCCAPHWGQSFAFVFLGSTSPRLKLCVLDRDLNGTGDDELCCLSLGRAQLPALRAAAQDSWCATLLP